MQKKIKGTILYIGGFELPDKNAAAHRVIANAKAFEKLGFEVVLIGVDKSLKSSSTLLDTKRVFEGFVSYSISYPKSFLQWLSYLSSIDYVKNSQNLSPTHIIAYNFPAIGLIRLITYCRRNEIKIIGDCTEWYQGTGSFVQRTVKSVDVYLRMKVFNFRLDGLIVISKYLNDFYSLKVKNIINIPPLVDLEQKKWPKGVEVNKKEAIEIIYAGSPGAGNKDRIDWLIINLSKLLGTTNCKVRLSIIGITQEEYLKVFKTRRNIENFVKFYGKMEHKEVLKKVNQAHFCLFLREQNRSNNAGFPTKLAEAISCGTPVLANSTSNISQFIQEGKTGFILDVSSYESFATSIMKAFSLTFEEIEKIKNHCLESRMFHFGEYLDEFNSFFNSVSK
ncbi:glycosyltransferase [Arcticibacterium luteifluviistationis]|uniref:Glycosyl transferase family 1 domain-containing protein n=1 Tax=Arcticibacterium luteifluviistationis TaxID=1784714 RepID=A0A2Z4GFT6_9BACT|nr:glycosyltransferase [Arcticibacterium luteifluviistationis]AWV99848.1 hypothetical protein DJ013_17385 [Arcticibacterium luteifluviistationis]